MNFEEAKSVVGEESPVFEAPPVVETALGARFAPIEGFTAVHFGQLLSAYSENYDRFELKPPLGTTVHFDISQDGANFNIPLRCWYLNSDGSQLVQLQNDLFIRNWRATDQRSEYQHYKQIKPLFRRDWGTFIAFLDRHSLKRPNVWQCEVSYVNHLVRGREWKTFEDLPQLFSVWRGCDLGGVFKVLEMAGFTVAFRLPDDNGRIQFTLQPGVRQDGTEILQLTVTAFGKPQNQTDTALLEWLDYGHLAVVNGFVQFTSPRAHEIWRMK